MQVRKHKVVSIDYRLTDDNGQMIDSSQEVGPLNYLHGERNVIPGLESALEGKSLGDQIQVSIDPADAYGERIEDLRQVVSREQFGDTKNLGHLFNRQPTKKTEFNDLGLPLVNLLQLLERFIDV